MREVNILDFGAVADGSTMNTAVIQKAIDALAQQGGGTLCFPEGVFLSGTLFLRGHITYRIEKNCVLKASPDLTDYVCNGFYHNEMRDVLAFLSARDQEDIRLTGEGVIDLSADGFMKEGCYSGYGEGIVREQLSDEQLAECTIAQQPRPNQPIFFESCRHVRVDTLTIRNSPCWTLTFSRCCDVRIDHIAVRNSTIVPNCDGIHLSACRDVFVEDSSFICGDDCVAVTCITAEGEKDISERIQISRCLMVSRSAGVRLGHYKGKVCDVLISDLIITDSNRGLAIFSNTEGYVENIRISNLILETKIFAGQWWGKGEAIVICAAKGEGRIENISITGVQARSQGGVLIAGCDRNIRHITIRDMDIRLEKGKNHALYGGDLDLQPNDYRRGNGGLPCIYAQDAADLCIEDFTYCGCAEAAPQIGDVEDLQMVRVRRRKD